MPPAVWNLTLVPEHIPGYEMLRLIALFPNMRCLTGMPKGGLCTLPDDEFRQKCNPFLTLERANFAHIDDDDDVRIVFEWILAAGQARPLRLTHFRLELECGLQHDELAQLLLVLTGAPLRVLALEGLALVEDDLFTRLSDAFPELTGLTLIHRQNLQQTTSRPSQWPGTTGEYARRLGSAFPALHHFIWNFHIWPLSCGTTFDLSLAEAGYPTALSREECEENCFEADWGILPRLFCAYCPKLETLVFSLLHIALMEFTVVRSADGAVLQRKYQEMAASEQFVNNNPMSPLNMMFQNLWYFVLGPPALQ